MTSRGKTSRPRHYVNLRRLVAVTSMVVGVLVMHGLMPSGQAGAHYGVIDANVSNHATGHGAVSAIGHAAPSAIGHGSSFIDQATALSAGTSISSRGQPGHGALGSCLAVLGALALGWLAVLARRDRASAPHPARSGFVPMGYRTTAVPRWPRVALCVIRV
ncbi:MAG: hypothetical protein M3P91_09440 [Actinomycetota bacterium]|nr:hypothetical protein [Actinomycetota bacterium]